MGVFKTRKNKKFSYTPRHYKGDSNPYEIKHKFDEYRKTVDSSGGLKGKINNAWDDYKNNTDEKANKRVLIIILVLILIFLFIIDFDLSIFFKN
ncbi:riboflavin synthase subunit beta [Mangrovimonas cancribranchiae]|uniref:Riboflavin synthase subunit beta n=1 Tax=Mangrovimonas cancribranchiae TaxID=3080055 RepID=A0AAU6P519_9FLAO